MNCPLCGHPMTVSGEFLACANPLHKIPTKDMDSYCDGRMTFEALRQRMKIRKGKMVRGK